MARPTEYKEEYVGRVEQYLTECQDDYEEWHKTRGVRSDTYERVNRVRLPTLEGFARFIDVNKSSLYEWEKEHKEFSDALGKIRVEQHDRLVNNGLGGIYSPVITKLMLSNNHGYREKTETDLTTGGEKMIFIPAELHDKHNLTPGTKRDSKGQA